MIKCAIDGTGITCTDVNQRTGPNDCFVSIEFSVTVCNQDPMTDATITLSYTLSDGLSSESGNAELDPNPVPPDMCATSSPVGISLDACDPDSFVDFIYLVESSDVCPNGFIDTVRLEIIPFRGP
jgi:hypothetical protein